MNSFSSQMEHHQFIREIVDKQVRPLVDKLHHDDSYSLSELEEYSKALFKWTMAIRACFETLEHARAYLGHFRSYKWYKEAGIGRSHYINYHYYNYAITVVKIMDIALILTDRTFRLGNPAKLCRLENIVENSWVRYRGIDKSLKKLESIVKSWREPRNLFVHRGETRDSRLLNLLGAWDTIIMSGELVPSILRSVTRRWYSKEVSEIFKEFEQTETPLFEATSDLLSQLLPIYRFWHDILKQIPNR
ncbi:hypothetical protein ES703_99856 [subsurface metagenome]